jgi:hypothetical protein
MADDNESNIFRARICKSKPKDEPKEGITYFEHKNAK